VLYALAESLADMNSGNGKINQTEHARRLKLGAKRTFVVLLLISVSSLATLARTNWYLPQSNPGHYLTIASKTIVVPIPAVLTCALLRPLIGLIPATPQVQVIDRTESVPIVSWTSLSITVQHRPPPSFSV
jgi:hypothetical protein